MFMKQRVVYYGDTYHTIRQLPSKYFPKKNSYIFPRKKPARKRFLTFSQKRAFLIFQETEAPKKIPYISGNGSPEKISYNSESILKSSKNKTNSLSKSFLYSEKWNFLVPILLNFFYFRRELVRPENQKFLILFVIKKRNFLN